MLVLIQKSLAIIQNSARKSLNWWRMVFVNLVLLFAQLVKVLSLLGAFITPFCWFACSEIIRIMYGQQWLAAIPCLQWMSLAMWAQMILSSAGSIFQSVGDTKRLFLSGSINAVLVVAFIIAGLFEGSITAVARNVALAYNIQFVATFYILVHLSLGLRCRDFLKGLLPDLAVMAVVALSGLCAGLIPEQQLVPSFLIKAGIMGGTYVAALAATRQLKPLLSLLFRR